MRRKGEKTVQHNLPGLVPNLNITGNTVLHLWAEMPLSPHDVVIMALSGRVQGTFRVQISVNG